MTLKIMSKLLLPMTCVFLMILAYQVIDQQQNQLAIAGKSLVNQMVSQELSLHSWYEKKFEGEENFREIILKSDALVSIELRNSSNELIHFIKYREAAKISSISVVESSIHLNQQKYQLISQLDDSVVLADFNNYIRMQSLYSYMFLAILFIFSLFVIVSMLNKAKHEKRRVEMDKRQKEFEKEMEIVELERNKRAMSEEIAVKENQLQLADKMSSLGVLSSGIAHEINNPNTYIMMNANTLSKVWADLIPALEKIYKSDDKIAGIAFDKMKDRLPELTLAIVEGSQRIEKIVSDLKSFAGNNRLDENKKVFSVKESIETAIRLSENFLKKHCLNFSYQLEDGLMVNGYPQKLEQVVINLLINASQALSSPDKKIELKLAKKDEEVFITIKDEGRGIKEENLTKIFDPFFTTKSENGGTGLGLSISYGIIVDMKGDISVQSKEGHYTEFVIRLPLV